MKKMFLILAALAALTVRSTAAVSPALPVNVPELNTVYVAGTTLQKFKGSNAPALAKSVAVAGNTILFGPGWYAVTNLLKQGVNYYGFAGCTLSNAAYAGMDRGVFDDRSTGATTNVIAGDWNFVHNLTSESTDMGAMLGFLVVTQANSRISFSGNDALFSTDNGLQESNAFIHVKNCSLVTVTMNEIKSNAWAAGSSDAAVFWEKGELVVKAKRIEMASSGYAIWCKEPAAGVSAHFRLECPYVSGGYSFYLQGVSRNWRNWLDVQEAVGIIWIDDGRNYIVNNAKIDVGGGAYFLINGGVNWIETQKLSSASQFVQIDDSRGGGWNFFSVQHYESTGAPLVPGFAAIDIFGGTNVFEGGVLFATNNIAIKCYGAHQTLLKDMTIQTIDTAGGSGGNTNWCIQNLTNGLTVQNISCKAPVNAVAVWSSNVNNHLSIEGLLYTSGTANGTNSVTTITNGVYKTRGAPSRL